MRGEIDTSRRGRRTGSRARTAVLLLLVAALLVAAAVTVDPPRSPGSRSANPRVFSGPTLVTSVGTTCVSKSNVTTATMGTLASGDSVFAFVEMAQGSSQTVAGVSSTVATDHWAQAGFVLNSGNTRAEIWYTSFTGGGAAYKVSVAASAAVDYCVQAVAFSGADLFHSFDVIGAGHTGSNTTAIDALTQAYANEYVLAAFAVKTTSTSQTLAQQGSWAIAQSNMATSGVGGGTVDQLVAATGTHTPAITLSTTLQWAGLAIAINNTGAPHTPPTGLTVGATVATSTTEHVSYTRPSNQPSGTVSNYTVLVGAAGGACGTQLWSSWTSFASSAGTSTAITVSSLSGGTDYCYGVVEWNATGHGPVSSTATAYTIPGAPTGITCGTVAPRNSKISCSWTNPTTGTGGLSNDSMYYWAGSSCSGTQLAATPSLGVVTSAAISGLTSATQYSIALAAWSPGGSSALSACQTLTTFAAAPTALSVTSTTASSVGVSWTNSAGNMANVTSFLSTTACTGSWTTASLGASATTHSFSGLSPATTYCIAIEDASSSGTVGPSFVNATTYAGIPSGLGVSSVSASGFTASWTNSGGSLSNVTSMITTTACTGSWTPASLGASATSHAFTGLSSATTYCVAIEDWSSSGTAGPAFVNGTTYAGLPSGLSVTAFGTTTITVGWTNAGGVLSNVTSFISTTACTGSWTPSSLGASAVTKAFSGLAVATRYCIGIQDWSSSGTSGSVFINETTLPIAPTAVSATVPTTGSVLVGWTSSPGHLVNGTVFVWAGSSCSGTVVVGDSVGSGTATSYVVAGLVAGTNYSVEVEDWSTSGSSVPSSCAAGATFPSAPSSVNVYAPAVSSLTVGWINSPGAIEYVLVEQWEGPVCVGPAVSYNFSGAPNSEAIAALSPGQEYSFLVVDGSAAGNSAPSACATGSTSTSTPSSPIVPPNAGGPSTPVSDPDPYRSALAGAVPLIVVGLLAVGILAVFVLTRPPPRHGGGRRLG